MPPRKSNEEDRTCTRCGEIFPKKYLLERHKAKKNPCQAWGVPISDRFICSTCNRTFKYKSYLTRHQKISEKCSNSSESRVTLSEIDLRNEVPEVPLGSSSFLNEDVPQASLPFLADETSPVTPPSSNFSSENVCENDTVGPKKPLSRRSEKRKEKKLWELAQELFGTEADASDAILNMALGRKRSCRVTRKRLLEHPRFRELAAKLVLTQRGQMAKSPENVNRSLQMYFADKKISCRSYKRLRLIEMKQSAGVPLAPLDDVLAAYKKLNFPSMRYMVDFEKPPGRKEAELGFRLVNLTAEEVVEFDNLARSQCDNGLSIVGAAFDLYELVKLLIDAYQAVDEYRLKNKKGAFVKYFSSRYQMQDAETGELLQDAESGEPIMAPCKLFVLKTGIDGFPSHKGPHTVMSYASPNIGSMCNSRDFNHILMGCSLTESAPQVIEYVKMFLAQAVAVNSAVFHLNDGSILKVKVDIVAVDQCMANKLVGASNQSGNFYSNYAQVSTNDYGILNGTVGFPAGSSLREQCSDNCLEECPFTAPADKIDFPVLSYEERCAQADAAAEERARIAKIRHRGMALAASTQKQKIREFLIQRRSRQKYHPPIGILSNNVFACILHLGINNFERLFKEFFAFVCKITTERFRNCSRPPTFQELELDESTADAPLCKLIAKMCCFRKLKRLREACVLSWDNGGKDLGCRFIGHDVKEMCHVFSALVESVFDQCQSEAQIFCTLRFLVTGMFLRNALCLANRFYISSEEITELEKQCRFYYNSGILLHDLRFPGIWTLRYIVPFHVKILRHRYGPVEDDKSLGLGATSTEGTEVKHRIVKFYSRERTNPLQKWEQILKYDVTSRIFLLKKNPGFYANNYRHVIDSYIPLAVQQRLVCQCGLPFFEDAEKCRLCMRPEMEKILSTVMAGNLPNDLRVLRDVYLNASSFSA